MSQIDAVLMASGPPPYPANAAANKQRSTRRDDGGPTPKRGRQTPPEKQNKSEKKEKKEKEKSEKKDKSRKEEKNEDSNQKRRRRSRKEDIA